MPQGLLPPLSSYPRSGSLDEFPRKKNPLDGKNPTISAQHK
jgi:hypothetical protein